MMMMVPMFHPQDQVILRALLWHPTKDGQASVLYLPQTQVTTNRIHHPKLSLLKFSIPRSSKA